MIITRVCRKMLHCYRIEMRVRQPDRFIAVFEETLHWTLA